MCLKRYYVDGYNASKSFSHQLHKRVLAFYVSDQVSLQTHTKDDAYTFNGIQTRYAEVKEMRLIVRISYADLWFYVRNSIM